MSGAWKPGDVAIASTPGIPDFLVVRMVDAYWSAPRDWPSGVDPRDCDYRRLVVIDPENAEQVERLRSALKRNYGTADDFGVQAALREFADPKPPKPAEPTGLGAVVEAGCGCDSESHRFVRNPDARDFNMTPKRGAATGAEVPWVSRCGHHPYADLQNVRVLSEGVTP